MADRFDVSTQSIPYGSVAAAGQRALQTEIFRREQMALAAEMAERQRRQDELARRQAESRMTVEQETATGLRGVREAAALKARQDAFLRGRVPGAVKPGEAAEGGKLKLGHLFLTTPPVKPETAKAGLAPGELEQKVTTPSVAGTTQYLGDEKQQKEARELQQTRDILAGKYDAMFADNPELGRYLKGQAMLDVMGRTGQIPAGIIDPKDPAATKASRDAAIEKIYFDEAKAQGMNDAKATIYAREKFNDLQAKEATQRQQFSFTVGDERAERRYLEQAKRGFKNDVLRERAPVRQTYERADRTITSLDNKTAAEDAVAIPEFLSVEAGGMGSGLRMTQAEINTVQSAQTKIRQWHAQLSGIGIVPGMKQYLIGPQLRKDMRHAIQLIKDKAGRRMKVMEDSIGKLDRTKSPDDVYDLQSEYWGEEIAAGETSPKSTAPTLPPGVTVTREP